jgi:hypothetical protein
MMADHQSTGSLADIDAMVTVSGMAHDPFVFFVKSVHGRPDERYPCLQFARVGRAGRCAATPLEEHSSRLPGRWLMM